MEFRAFFSSWQYGVYHHSSPTMVGSLRPHCVGTPKTLGGDDVLIVSNVFSVEKPLYSKGEL